MFDPLTAWTLALLTTLAIVYYYLTSTFDYWSKCGVASRKPTIFLGNFGDALLFRKSQPEAILDMYMWFRKSRFFGAYRVRTPVLIIRDPSLIKDICSRDFSCFTNRAIPVNRDDPLSGHLFNLEGQAWKVMRGRLTPAFTAAKMRRMFELLLDCHEQLRSLIVQGQDDLDPRLSEGQGHRIVEIRDLAAKFTIDVIGCCAFGIRMNAMGDSDSAFRKMAARLSAPGYKATLWRMLRTSFPGLYRALGVRVVDPEVTKFFSDTVARIIEQRIRDYDASRDHRSRPNRRYDFLDLLMELREKPDDPAGEQPPKKELLDDNAIAAQAFVFFVAGNETSSNTIAFALYELALNGEMQERARREIHDELDRENGQLTYDAIQRMEYLDMIILETLRKYPPAPLLSRKCERPYRIEGTEIVLPAGMRVVIPIYGIHHDPEYYPSPESFDPERFADKQKNLIDSFAFLPFGKGPRSCIGMRFALLQTKIGIVSFLRDRRVGVCEKTVVPMKFSKRSLVTSSEAGIWLNISPMK